MALIALALAAIQRDPRWRDAADAVGVFGASLFYGDAVITPAISVLSAVEGLEVGTPAFEPYVVPIAVVVLVALFLIQRRGTAAVGALFGPIMVVWFARARALLGRLRHRAAPGGARGAQPAVRDRLRHRPRPRPRFLVLGSVVLAVTGAEALYADMGHFGRRAIRIAWFGLVLPALVLNYLGQGALLLREPGGDREPVLPAGSRHGRSTRWCARHRGDRDRLAGDDLRRLLADAAGDAARLPAAHAASCTPRRRELGQIYMPAVNWVLLAAVLAVVLGFGSSTRPGGGLRRRGDRHHADHHAARRSSSCARLGLAAVLCVLRDRLLPRHRRRVLLRQPAQDRSTAAGSRWDRRRWSSR